MQGLDTYQVFMQVVELGIASKHRGVLQVL